MFVIGTWTMSENLSKSARLDKLSETIFLFNTNLYLQAMKNHMDFDQLASQKVVDLDLHCFQNMITVKKYVSFKGNKFSLFHLNWYRENIFPVNDT